MRGSMPSLVLIFLKLYHTDKETEANLLTDFLFNKYFRSGYSAINIIGSDSTIDQLLPHAESRQSFYVTNESNARTLQTGNCVIASGTLTEAFRCCELLHQWRNFEKTPVIIDLNKETNITDLLTKKCTVKTRNVIVANATHAHIFDFFSKKGRIFHLKDPQAIDDYLQRPPNYHRAEVRSLIYPLAPYAMKSASGELLGMDPTIKKVLGEKLNLDFKTRVPSLDPYFNYMGEFRNNCATGILGELSSNRSDISFNNAFLMDYGSRGSLDPTHYVFSDNVCAIVRKKTLKPTSVSIMGVLISPISAVSLAVILLSVPPLRFIRKNRLSRSYPGLVIEMAQIVYNNRTNRPGKYQESVLVFFLLLFALFNSVVIQSALVGVVTRPHRYKNIDSLKDLDASGLKISVRVPQFFGTFAAYDRLHGTDLDSKLYLINKTAPRGEAYLIRRSRYEFLKQAEKKTSGKVDSHLVSECPLNYVTTYLVRNGAFFRGDVDLILGRIVEGGLVNFWKCRGFSEAISEIVPGRTLELKAVYPLPFHFGDLRYALVLYGIGMGAGLIVFGLEIMGILPLG